MKETFERPKKIRRQKGVLGAESRGMIKCQILFFINDSNDWTDREAIVDYVKEWSANNLDIPIKSQSGIYTHIKDLSDKYKLIKKEGNEIIGYKYFKDTSFDNFKSVVEFVFNSGEEFNFMQTDYYDYCFVKYIAGNGLIGKKFNMTLNKDSMENTIYLKAFLFSPSLLNYLVLDNSMFENKENTLNIFAKVYERIGFKSGLLKKFSGLLGKIFKITRTDVFLLVSIFVMYDYFKYPKFRELVDKNYIDKRMEDIIKYAKPIE